MPYLDVVTNIRRDQTRRWILQNVGIKLLTLGNTTWIYTRFSRTPILPRYRVPVVWIGRKQIGVVEGAKVDGIYHLFFDIPAHDALGFLLDFVLNMQLQARDVRNYGNHHQQFNNR